jgi:hypothetical protein
MRSCACQIWKKARRYPFTIERLKQERPATAFFLIGADAFSEIETGSAGVT